MANGNGRRTALPAPWRRVDDGTRKTSARYQHPRGYLIEHCGHPTALWPYALYGPDGHLILAPNGRGWQKVIDAALEVDRRINATEPRCHAADPTRRAWCMLASGHAGRHQDSWGMKFND
jgi:hypothetical protein